MLTLITILPIFIYTIAALSRGTDQKWRIDDRRGYNNKKWKVWAAINDLCMYITAPVFCILAIIYQVKIIDVFTTWAIAGSWYWLLSEISINVFTWGWKQILYVGQDKSFPDSLGKKKWYLLFGLFAITIIIKIIFQ